MPDEIERNGSPQGWHSGPTKKNHIESFKSHASQTNRRCKTLDAQIGAQNAESFIINSAFQKMTVVYLEGSQTTDDITVRLSSIQKTASKALIYIYKQDHTMEVGEPVWVGTGTGPIHPWLVLFFKQHFESIPGTSEYDLERQEAHGEAWLATEYNCAGQIFCANLNYRNGGPWYDCICSGGQKKVPAPRIVPQKTVACIMVTMKQ